MKESTSPQYSEAALQLEAVFKTATDGIIIIDQRGRMELVNKAAASLFDYDISEMIGNNVSMLMPEPHHSSHDGYIGNYVRTGDAQIIGVGREVEGKKKDNTTFPFRLSISEVPLKERRLFAGIIHDLTAEKEAQRALEEEKEKAQMYFDLANTINVVMDNTLNIVELNDKGCAFIGHPEESVQGKEWFSFILSGTELKSTRITFKNMIEEKIPLQESLEIKVKDNSGQIRHYTWKNNYIRNKAGSVIGIISSGMDITELREAEQQILKMNAELEKRVEYRTEELANAVNQLLNTNKKLEYEVQERSAAEEALRKNQRELRKAYENEKELSKLKSRFVSMASHEFRTPLSTILSSADLIEAYIKEEQQPKRERHTNRIKSAVANLTGILNDFLSLSKLEEGKVNYQPVTFHLEAFCAEVMDELNGLLKPNQQITHKGVAPQVQVFLDKKMLRNIFYNLLSNAIKYSDTEIACNLDIRDGDLKIEVKDDGIGIPEEEQQHLFTRFFRAHNVENIQGTGLGLNIVKRYVELMSGNITFESKLGKGTTFYVDIPLKQPEA